MLRYSAFHSTGPELLHQAFLRAFSDYQVKMDLPFPDFEQMLRRRGYCPELSVGAFQGEELVGFVLNGFRSWNGKPTVYDLGTGVVPECRRQGLTNEMLRRTKLLLKENQVEQYLLEVIQTNDSALALYKKQGFRESREFSCFRAAKTNLVRRSDWPVEPAAAIDFEAVKEFWDFSPSWQNSADSIHAAPEAFVSSVVRRNKEIAGYGIADRKTGDIPQLAVKREYRGKGIARSILTDLANRTESARLCMLNMETSAESTEKFLRASGFTPFVGQYEMLLAL